MGTSRTLNIISFFIQIKEKIRNRQKKIGRFWMVKKSVKKINHVNEIDIHGIIVIKISKKFSKF